jgi:hypothetical protein
MDHEKESLALVEYPPAIMMMILGYFSSLGFFFNTEPEIFSLSPFLFSLQTCFICPSKD